MFCQFFVLQFVIFLLGIEKADLTWPTWVGSKSEIILPLWTNVELRDGSIPVGFFNCP